MDCVALGRGLAAGHLDICAAHCPATGGMLGPADNRLYPSTSWQVSQQAMWQASLRRTCMFLFHSSRTAVRSVEESDLCAL